MTPPPIELGLGLGISLHQDFGGLDPDAAAYIAGVTADGATVTPTIAAAINTFVSTGKTEGWYASLRRFYLPIWGSASPNSRCLVSLAKGTFIGSVTHAAGHVRSNNTESYFLPDAGASVNSIGITSINVMLGHIALTVNSNTTALHGLRGAGTSTIRCYLGKTQPTTKDFRSGDLSAFSQATAATGVWTGAVFSSNDRVLMRNGVVAGSTNVNASGVLPNIVPFFLATNDGTNAPIWGANDEQNGAYWVGVSPTQARVTQLSNAVRDLWQQATGLTIP